MYFLYGAIIWCITLFVLCCPISVYKNAFDRLTRGSYRHDKANLQIMLDHLNSYPDDWSISSTTAHFPKTGAKHISFDLDRETGALTYSVGSAGFRPLAGHFGNEFTKVIRETYAAREKQALLVKFYPETHGQLLLK